MRKTIIVFLFILCKSLSAQHIEVGLGSGVSIYNGDLGHHTYLWDSKSSHVVFQSSIGYHFNKVFSASLVASTSKLSGYDQFATKQYHKIRNLSFTTRVNEVALLLHTDLCQVLIEKECKLAPIFSFGFGIFKFDPYAKHEGSWVRLQPIRTEGQGLPGSSSDPYQLIESNFTFGLGLKYKLSEKIAINLGTSVRLTTTDYIDDVSGDYYDPMKLNQFLGEQSAELSYRTYELGSDYPQKPDIGSHRGNASKNDSYLFHTLGMSYRL